MVFEGSVESSLSTKDMKVGDLRLLHMAAITMRLGRVQATRLLGLIMNKVEEAKWESVSNIIHKGGTMIGASRSEGFRKREERKQVHDHGSPLNRFLSKILSNEYTGTNISI